MEALWVKYGNRLVIFRIVYSPISNKNRSSCSRSISKAVLLNSPDEGIPYSNTPWIDFTTLAAVAGVQYGDEMVNRQW